MLRNFQRGSGCYRCTVCGRQTRNTGAQSHGSRLCPQCWELSGVENDIDDGHVTLSERMPDILRTLADIKAHGGNVAEWLGIFEITE